MSRQREGKVPDPGTEEMRSPAEMRAEAARDEAEAEALAKVAPDGIRPGTPEFEASWAREREYIRQNPGGMIPDPETGEMRLASEVFAELDEKWARVCALGNFCRIDLARPAGHRGEN